MKMNGPKSSYITTEATQGITPDWNPTLKGTWVGGRDGHFFPDAGPQNRLIQKAADEAVRNLGVWRAASGTIDTQQAILENALDKIAPPLKQYGIRLSATHIAYVINAVLMPRLAYPLRDSSACRTREDNAMVQNLDKHIRSVFKQCRSISDKTSSAQIDPPRCEGGYGLLSLRDVVDRAVVERFWRSLHLCPRVAYWDRMTMREDAALRADGVRRQHLVCVPHVTAHAIRETGRSDCKDEEAGHGVLARARQWLGAHGPCGGRWPDTK